MDRRRFLELGSAAALGSSGVLGLGLGMGEALAQEAGPALLAQAGIALQPGLSASAAWQALGKFMPGRVLLPDNPAYEAARLVVNSRYNDIHPQVVVQCQSAPEVLATLALARHLHQPITPRSGGHGYTGNSINRGVVIDTKLMNQIQVHANGTATIGAGARLVDIYDQLTAQGVCIPAGSCPSVGIAGLTQGGGVGVVDRMYGLTCDNLLAAEVVTTDGRILHCDARHEPDLFWALRGGGGGNFGIATSFTFKTHATRDLVNFFVAFKNSDSTAVISAWQDWLATLPDTVWTSLSITFFGPQGYAVIAGVAQETEASFAPLFASLLGRFSIEPLASNVSTSSYRDTVLAYCGGRTVPQCHVMGDNPDAQLERFPFVASSDFFNHALPPEGVQALSQAVQAAFGQGYTGYAVLVSLGGAVSRVTPNATAFPHRKALFSIEYVVDALNGSNPTWCNDMRSVMRPWSSGGAYVNYLDSFITDWKQAYYQGNYPRLARIKARYDGARVLRMAQGVEPAY